MDRVAVTPAQSAFIRERVERFDLEAADGERRYLSALVRAHKALPLYSGWTETIAIHEDGVMVRWVTEEWPGAQELDDRTWVNLALVQGAARYPELRDLIPTRPDNALTCDSCQGAGRIPGLPDNLKQIICGCGGIGWLYPDTGTDIIK
jgi:hypothetical protein